MSSVPMAPSSSMRGPNLTPRQLRRRDLAVQILRRRCSFKPYRPRSEKDMRAILRFRDHEGFQRAALHMAIAGVLAGLAVYVMSLTVPGFGPITAAWAAAGLLAAAAFGA